MKTKTRYKPRWALKTLNDHNKWVESCTSLKKCRLEEIAEALEEELGIVAKVELIEDESNNIHKV